MASKQNRRRNLWLSTAQAWRFAERPRVRDWVLKNIRVPGEMETPGAFDASLVPHVDGVLHAADDPEVREIYLRWSTRNGKTFTALSILACLVSETGRPGMLCSADEERVNDVIDGQFYPMLESCEPIRDRLPKAWNRSIKRGVVIGKARIRRAFQKSKSKLASFPACYGVANEAGLYELAAIGRFRHRARLFPFHSLLIFEGKPENKGSCAISHLADKESTQRRFRFVPCPHCGKFQRLVWGDQKPDGPGVKWETGKDGKSSTKLARETVHYQCENGCRIDNANRAEMMRRGVWVAEGCEVDAVGTITGNPKQPSRYVAFDGLSALYSLAIDGWGQLAAEWLDACKNIETIREFVTATLAEAWEVKERKVDASVVGKRLGSHENRGVVPDWGVFLTQSFDVQTSGGQMTFPWQVCAWGANQRGHLVDYGVCRSLDEFRNMLKTQTFSKAGGAILTPSWRSIDTSDGNVTEEIYSLCREFIRLLPRKGGSSQFANNEGLRLFTIGATDSSVARRVSPQDCIGSNGVIDGQPVLMLVNTERSQQWVQRQLDGSMPADSPSRFTLCAEAAIDGLLHEQLVNEHKVEELNKQGYKSTKWKRVDFGKPNDQRDVLRDNWTLAQLVTNDGAWWVNVGAGSSSVGGVVQTTPQAQAPAPQQPSQDGLLAGFSWDSSRRRGGAWGR